MDAATDDPAGARRDTRTAALDAAWALLERHGSPALTMGAVAEATGITRRGLYLHFASRGQLFAALFDHVNQRLDLEGSLRPAREAPDAVTALTAWARHVAGYHSRLVPVVRAVDRARHDDADAAQLWQAAMGAWYGGCRALAAALAAEGRLQPGWTPDTAADLLWTLMSVELVDDLIGECGWSVNELAERLALVARRALVIDG